MQLGNNLALTNVSRNKFDSPKWRRHLALWVMENGYNSKSRIRIEPKANGKVKNTDGLDETIILNVFADLTKDGNKEVMLEDQLPKLESGRVLLPGTEGKKPGLETPVWITYEDGSKACYYAAAWVPEFLSEVLKFPKSEYADQVDCLTQAMRNELRTKIPWDKF